MADYGKGMIMGRSSCDWVHARLPLLVDDGDGLACEDNDLDTEDRRLIKDHLTHCPRCQQRQTDLKKAFTVLSIAAAEMAGLQPITLAQARRANSASSPAIPFHMAALLACDLS